MNLQEKKDILVLTMLGIGMVFMILLPIVVISFIVSEAGRKEPNLWSGRLVVIEDTLEQNNDNYQWLAYDQDTKIIYICNKSRGKSMSASVFYVMDDNNEPEIGVYWE